MKSCLYECDVMHARFEPSAHRFSYRIFMFALDLDEVPDLARRLSFFSLGRPNLYSFREADYLPLHEAGHNPSGPAVQPCSGAGLRARVEALAAAHGVNLAGGRVLLVTLPRVLGYLFNPVSFYFCLDRDGRPAAAIAEVTNTFREMKPYFLRPDPAAASRGEFRLRVPKHFYVSPFSDVDVAFDFHLHLPGDRLAVQIDDLADGRRTQRRSRHVLQCAAVITNRRPGGAHNHNIANCHFVFSLQGCVNRQTARAEAAGLLRRAAFCAAVAAGCA